MFHSLKVKSVTPETSEAVVIAFEVPTELKDTFTYKHGQYLTLKFVLGGKEVRRAYSVCSSPLTDADMAICVKRVEKGLVSTHICKNVKAGDQLEVMAPEGRFTCKLENDHRKDYFLIGAGSGITPLLSIAKSVMEAEPKSQVHLLYGNRNEDGILFQAELERLQKRYSGQFNVEHTLSKPKVEKEGGLFGAFKKGKMNWTGSVGRIDTTKAAKFIEEFRHDDGRPAEYFLCGPSDMMKTVEKYLQNRGEEDKHIHAEWFTSLDAADKTTASAGVSGAVVTATLGGKVYTFTPTGKETILDALRKQGVDAPYSCMAGACATCMAKVSHGEVKMDTCFALDQDEVKQGFCLTCQAHPASAEVTLSFDI